MDKEITGILNEYISAVAKQNPNFFKAYLFGSYATNRHHKDSDIDIALIIDNLDDNDRFDLQIKLMVLAATIDTRIEPHPISKIELSTNNPFVLEIKRTGIEILNA